MTFCYVITADIKPCWILYLLLWLLYHLLWLLNLLLTAISIALTAIHITLTAIHTAPTSIPIALTALPFALTAIPTALTAIPIILTTIPIALTTIPIALTAIPIADCYTYCPDRIPMTAIPIVLTTIPITLTTIPIAATVGGLEGVRERGGGPHVQFGIVRGTVGVAVDWLQLVSLGPGFLHEGQENIGWKRSTHNCCEVFCHKSSCRVYLSTYNILLHLVLVDSTLYSINVTMYMHNTIQMIDKSSTLYHLHLLTPVNHLSNTCTNTKRPWS